jgi:hypothetical protein
MAKTPRKAANEREEKKRPRQWNVPLPQTEYVVVQLVGDVVVYTAEGTPIPPDEWIRVPLSPGVVRALKYGDLREGTEEDAPDLHAMQPAPVRVSSTATAEPGPRQALRPETDAN